MEIDITLPKPAFDAILRHLAAHKAWHEDLGELLWAYHKQPLRLAQSLRVPPETLVESIARAKRQLVQNYLIEHKGEIERVIDAPIGILGRPGRRKMSDARP